MSADLYARGIELFNSSEFYAAHEVWEDVWRPQVGPHKLFLQGLIQAAVALHHHSTGNIAGACSLLGRATRNLSSYPENYSNLELARFRLSLQAWQQALEQRKPTPPFPKLEPIPGSPFAKIAFLVTNSSATKRPASEGTAAPVPMLDLGRQYQQIREQILNAVERVCESQHFILGEEVTALEKEVAAYTGAENAVACSSGTDALWLALLAAGVHLGDAVVTTSFSFLASASSIARAGARPIFVDIDPKTFNLDLADLRKKLESRGSRVRAILPVHLYGQCVDMDAITELAGEFKVHVVEDAAQAIGAKWKEKHAGSLGQAAAFSFYPTKNLSAYGDAGLVTSRDADWSQHMRRLRNHGSPQRYVHDELGWNCRMDAIQAAILRVKLCYIEEWNQKRRERAGQYGRLFDSHGLTKAGTKVPSSVAPVVLPYVSPNAHHVFHQYVLRVQRRDELRAFLNDWKISTEIYYPIPLHLQPCFEYLGYREGDLPQAELAAKQVLALPMFPELEDQEQEWVVEKIAEFYS